MEGRGYLTSLAVGIATRHSAVRPRPCPQIPGACHQAFAHQALEAEDKIGMLMPCNVVGKQTPSGGVEVAGRDPLGALSAVQVPKLAPLAEQMRAKMKAVINHV